MMRSFAGVVTFVICMLSGVALADDAREALPRVEPVEMLRGLVRESDVTLLFDFLRSSLAAAMQGREAPVPEELKERAEALGNALRAQGALAALVMLSVLEERAKRALRGQAAPPATAAPASPSASPND